MIRHIYRESVCVCGWVLVSVAPRGHSTQRSEGLGDRAPRLREDDEKFNLTVIVWFALHTPSEKTCGSLQALVDFSAAACWNVVSQFLVMKTASAAVLIPHTSEASVVAISFSLPLGVCGAEKWLASNLAGD